MKKNLPILCFCAFILCFILSSCGKFPPREPVKHINYNKEGISFSYPENWRISDDEQLDEISYYIACEKRGLDESGVFVITWITDSVGLEELLDAYKAEMEENPLYSNLNFEGDEPGTFAKITTLSCKFTFSTLGLRHRGIMHGFYSCDRTFFVMKQEAKEDKKKNTYGFELLDSTFTCK